MNAFLQPNDENYDESVEGECVVSSASPLLPPPSFITNYDIDRKDGLQATKLPNSVSNQSLSEVPTPKLQLIVPASADQNLRVPTPTASMQSPSLVSESGSDSGSDFDERNLQGKTYTKKEVEVRRRAIYDWDYLPTPILCNLGICLFVVKYKVDVGVVLDKARHALKFWSSIVEVGDMILTISHKHTSYRCI